MHGIMVDALRVSENRLPFLHVIILVDAIVGEKG